MQNFEYKIKSIEKSVKLTKILIQQMANFNSNKSKKLLEKWYWKILEIIIKKEQDNKVIYGAAWTNVSKNICSFFVFRLKNYFLLFCT